jgi:large subunit ribosomal protein L9
VVLHPEVSLPVTVNVARSPEEAEKQARGERVTAETAEAPVEVAVEAMFEAEAVPEQPSVPA